MPVVNTLRQVTVREIEIPGPHIINIGYREKDERQSLGSIAKTTKMEWIEIDVVYQALTNRWFGIGVDVWLQLYEGCRSPMEDGWNFMPAFKAFAFDLLLGLPEPEIRLRPETQTDLGPKAINFRDECDPPGRPEVICGPFDWRWNRDKPLENYARVIGAFYREAPTVHTAHRRP